jgi:outer membrane immunogenic protein
MFERFALGVAFTALISVPALAADIEVAPEPEAAFYDWSGFYIGAHVGYGEADVNGVHDDAGAVPLEWGLEPNGIIGGVDAGFNWQFSSIVLGIEGDFSFADWDDDVSNIIDESASAELDWLATVRARLGFALDNFLIYGTVGAAWTDAEITVSDAPGDSGSVDFDDVALVAGGGLEWAWSERWSWKLEGLWFNFDDEEDTRDLTTDSDIGDFVELDDAWVVWTGLRYHF